MIPSLNTAKDFERARMETPIGYGDSRGFSLPASSEKLVLKGNISNLPEKSRMSTRFPWNLWGCISYSRRRHKKAKLTACEGVSIYEKTTLPDSAASSCYSVMESSIEAAPYHWPHDRSFDPKTTALVIIDMQMDCEC